jgi:AhpD family alkylhydroperoxidase
MGMAGEQPLASETGRKRAVSPTRFETHRLAIRVVLVALGLIQLVDGLWAFVAPASFYREFPLGRGWVELLPAYNEHLVRDVGALFLATASVLLAAAWLLERRVVAVAVGSYLLFAVPHAGFHFLNLEPFEIGDAVANGLSLGGSVVLPAWVLLQFRRPRQPLGQSSWTEPESDGRPRIKPVEDGQGGLLGRMAYRESRRRYGSVTDPLRVMAHRPRILAGAAALELASEHSHALSTRLKHLAELRAGMVCGCGWCLDFGSAISAEMGVDEADLEALPAYEINGHFDELEKLLLDYASAMSRTPAEVSDELFAELSGRLTDPQLVELTNIIALENYRARFNWALGLEAQGFSEGSVCLGPEAQAEIAASRRDRRPSPGSVGTDP